MKRIVMMIVALALAYGAFAQPTPGPSAEPAALDARAAVGEPQGRPLAGAALDQAAQELDARLRCPVCQGQSIADSSSPLAADMRRQVRELLTQGFSNEQICAYFERSYGEFVRLDPPLRGVNWLIWTAPIAALLLGAAWLLWAMRRNKIARGATAVDSDPLPDDAELARQVLRVREMAYGWPDGRRPAAPAGEESGS
ncbi:MAG: cytochrome c-type biogenesis protein CcmH [Vicinamibacteria bacterium]|jgi:cytochrome c-type biogenesis protein CcmH|nr:cytochrome c-type biogenesis protein CcmH [Vicinamibacteria bacterium]